MRVRLLFEHGEQVELSCSPEDFAPVVLTQRFTVHHELPQLKAITFMASCAYCGAEFETANPLKKYDSKSHRNLASLYRLPSAKRREPEEI